MFYIILKKIFAFIQATAPSSVGSGGEGTATQGGRATLFEFEASAVEATGTGYSG